MLVLVVTTHLYKTNKRKERKKKKQKEMKERDFFKRNTCSWYFCWQTFFLIFSSGEKKNYDSLPKPARTADTAEAASHSTSHRSSITHTSERVGISLKIAEEVKNSLQKPIEEKWWNFDRKIRQGNQPMKFLRQHNFILRFPDNTVRVLRWAKVH